MNVYGMTYDEWKTTYQKESTAEQQEAYKKVMADPNLTANLVYGLKAPFSSCCGSTGLSKYPFEIKIFKGKGMPEGTGTIARDQLRTFYRED